VPSTTFGSRLREWRHIRGLSQLDLAARADVSQRHISFIETGRSRPSREMVVHLGRSLDIPPREQNLLLTAAGHAPQFGETPLDQLDEIAGVLDFMLTAHEPHMAIVVDRQWNVIRANRAAMRFVELMYPEPADWFTPLNVMRLNFHPEGLRGHMVGWEPTAAALLARLKRDAASYPSDLKLHDLLDEIQGYPGVDELRRQLRAEGGDLLVPATYLIDGEEISLFTTISIIGDAHDLTLAELRLETFWPMDQITAKRWEQLVGV
jgi:transcriptional regulator with XRE-family HTH domain